jgi:ankyrin repeat protein
VIAATNEGATLLHDAELKGHETVTKLLLDRGTEVKAANNMEWTVLYDAAQYEVAEMPPC